MKNNDFISKNTSYYVVYVFGHIKMMNINNEDIQILQYIIFFFLEFFYSALNHENIQVVTCCDTPGAEQGVHPLLDVT